MEDFPAEKPAPAWIAYLVAIVGLLAITFAALLYLSPPAHAKEHPICAPANDLFPQFSAVVKEKVIWEGSMTIPQGVLQFVLFQSEKGTWTLFTIQPGGLACIAAKGEAGTPNELGKGT